MAEFIDPWLGDKVDYPMPELTLSPQSGSKNSAAGYKTEKSIIIEIHGGDENEIRNEKIRSQFHYYVEIFFWDGVSSTVFACNIESHPFHILP